MVNAACSEVVVLYLGFFVFIMVLIVYSMVLVALLVWSGFCFYVGFDCVWYSIGCVFDMALILFLAWSGLF